jgi:hypothetical protein
VLNGREELLSAVDYVTENSLSINGFCFESNHVQEEYFGINRNDECCYLTKIRYLFIK